MQCFFKTVSSLHRLTSSNPSPTPPPPILHMPSDAPHTFTFLLRRTTYPPPSLSPLTLHILLPFPFRCITYLPLSHCTLFCTVHSPSPLYPLMHHTLLLPLPLPLVPSYAPHTPPPPPPPPPPCTLLCTTHSPSASPLYPLMHRTLPLLLSLVNSCAPLTLVQTCFLFPWKCFPRNTTSKKHVELTWFTKEKRCRHVD